MGSELDFALPETGEALAMILDGRESVAVPTWRTNGGPLRKFRALPYGPIVLSNRDYVRTLDIKIFESEDPRNVADSIENPFIYSFGHISLAPGRSYTLTPRKPYLALGEVYYTVICQPVGILARGPSAMPAQVPMEIQKENY